MDKRRANAEYYLSLLGIVVLSFLVHEAGHYLTGRLLGYDMKATLNSVSLRAGNYRSPAHAAGVTLAGPAVTLLQALVAVALIRLEWREMLAYAVLFAALMTRLLATGVSLFHPNDEARLSLYLGWNQWVLPLLVVALLTALAVYATRNLSLHWRVNLWSWVVASIGVTIVVGVDRWVFH